MRHGHELDIERADLETAAQSNDGHGNFRCAWLPCAFGFEQSRREGRSIDRDFQPWPQVDQRAEMVFVRMREHQTRDVLPFFDEVSNVRQDQVDARKMLLGRKRHAKIDSEPCAPALIANAVDRQVHADLPDPSKWRKNQFLRSGHVQRSPKPKTSPAVTGVMLPACSSSRRPASSRPWKRPESSRSGSRTCRTSPRPAARLSQSTRVAENPKPPFHCARRFCMAPASPSSKASGTTSAPRPARSAAG